MQSHELREISVTRICEMAQINRTTFYANYEDIYDLSRKVLELWLMGNCKETPEEIESILKEEYRGR